MDKMKSFILKLNVYPLCMNKGQIKKNVFVDEVHVNLYFSIVPINKKYKFFNIMAKHFFVLFKNIHWFKI